MENPFRTANEVVDVTRVEFEILDNGRIRWTAWQDSRRVHSVLVLDGREPQILECTRILLETMQRLKRPQSLKGT